ncbi:LuxR family transcriptional regulator [uncultured Phycicoccus sp.]|uniref:LuxR family transcriptional regulator n=1 Tax=uncultured Phycicoccus sp. TaxID=661422 RepID=UPI00262236C0|nr:LuxR family transcriptional regulator [uncultured Phycicoccus sp.]
MARARAGALNRDTVDRLAAKQSDSRAFRAAVLDHLRRAVGFDWFAWVVTDPGTTVGVDPLAHLPDLAVLPTVIRLKYLTAVNRWTTLGDAALLGGQAAESPLWREVQRRYRVVDVASVVFRDRFGCWGFLDLWSTRGYGADDVELLRQLAPGLTAALRVRQSRTFGVVPARTGRSLPGPAVLLLRDDLSLLGQTDAAQEWLRMMLPQPDGVRPIPAGAYNVAAQLLAGENGVDDHEPMARIHLTDGLWVTLRASRLDPGDLVAVAIEPTAPGDRLDVFARAHGLSDRERELVELLAQGADTAEAAARMSVSSHTVQDHLKAVFTKTGTRNRRVLLSHALGVRTDETR